MEAKAAQILKTVLYATVATSGPSGEPWNSPVYCVYDEAFSLYWASGSESQHSQNIRANPRVFVVVYDSTVPWGTGTGVFIQAEAIEVDDPKEIAKACRLRKDRVPNAKHPPEDFMGDRPRRIYRATPTQAWTNQDGEVRGHFVDGRVLLDLHKLRNMV